MQSWPEWWDWEIELSPHLYRRMIDRGFNEVDLRSMLAEPLSLDPNHEEGRWIVHARLGGAMWEIAVEPDDVEQRLVIITAYALE